MDAITGHQVKVSGWPYGAPTPDGYYAKCSCGWAGTVHGRETDASEDGKSHQMIYAWQPEEKIEQVDKCTGYEQHSETGMVRACTLPAGHNGRHKHKISPPTPLLLWNQAVAVLREDKYLVTQSSRNYTTALSRVGLGSPADEIDNVNPSCDCDYCVIHRGEIAEQEYEKYEQLDAYRNFRDERLRRRSLGMSNTRKGPDICRCGHFTSDHETEKRRDRNLSLVDWKTKCQIVKCRCMEFTASALVEFENEQESK